MSEQQIGERMTRLEERFIALRDDFQSRVNALEANQSRLVWIVVGGVVSALLAMVISGGR